MTEKYIVEKKIHIVIESLSATNIAELRRRHGISVVQLHRWKDKFNDCTMDRAVRDHKLSI